MAKQGKLTKGARGPVNSSRRHYEHAVDGVIELLRRLKLPAGDLAAVVRHLAGRGLVPDLERNRLAAGGAFDKQPGDDEAAARVMARPGMADLLARLEQTAETLRVNEFLGQALSGAERRASQRGWRK